LSELAFVNYKTEKKYLHARPATFFAPPYTNLLFIENVAFCKNAELANEDMH
jgi:hypothetical protein